MITATIAPMSYPADALFDIETLVNVAQPSSIVLIGDQSPEFLAEYQQQKQLLNQDCTITQIKTADITLLSQLEQRFDVGIAIDVFEHIEKIQGVQILSRLRDVLTRQYCVCLPLGNLTSQHDWQLTDLFSFALNRVALYQHNNQKIGLFKYHINDYKKTPDWLNADNWANPNMWGKFRW